MYRPNAVKTSSVVTESLLLVLTAGRFLPCQIEEFGNLSASADGFVGDFFPWIILRRDRICHNEEPRHQGRDALALMS